MVITKATEVIARNLATADGARVLFIIVFPKALGIEVVPGQIHNASPAVGEPAKGKAVVITEGVFVFKIEQALLPLPSLAFASVTF